MDTTDTKTTTPTGRKTTTAHRKPRAAAKPAAAKATPAEPAAAKPTAAKPAAPKPTAAKPATAASPTSASASTPETSDDTRFKRQNLISAVADRSSVKRSEVKEVVELVLEELGKAIDGGDELVLQPLGKVTVKQRKDTPNGAQLTVKLKRPGSASN